MPTSNYLHNKSSLQAQSRANKRFAASFSSSACGARRKDMLVQGRRQALALYQHIFFTRFLPRERPGWREPPMKIAEISAGTKKNSQVAPPGRHNIATFLA